MKTVCVVTSSRADYGILFPLLCRLQNEPKIELRLVVTGTHLSGLHGNTVDEIAGDGIPVHARIPIFMQGSTDTSTATSRTMAHAITEFASYFAKCRPDMLLVLGDRYEICAVCIAASNARIPIAHLHGGETTQGAADEFYRHSITKMSYLHFTANEVYRNRVIQLGEEPDRVFNVGALGVENAIRTIPLPLKDLEADLQFNLSDKKYAVVTFHPVTLEEDTALEQVSELLQALAFRQDLQYIITKSNADSGGDAINAAVDKFARENPHCRIVASLGMRRYMSALRYAAFVIGNSSSGLIEAPVFGIPTINIGDRQRGRMQAESVINCMPERKGILQAIDMALSSEYKSIAARTKNPYGSGETSRLICEKIRCFLYGGKIDLKKNFYDVDFGEKE